MREIMIYVFFLIVMILVGCSYKPMAQDSAGVAFRERPKFYAIEK